MSLRIWSDFIVYFLHSVKEVFTPPYRVRDTFAQLEFVTWQSLPVILFCVSFAAVVTTMESSFHMKLVVQNDALVPGFAALLILRELGVVVSALLLTSRVGAGIAAEVGSMQITEQIDALRMLGISPIRFLVVPRLIACVVGLFLLSILANLVCLYMAMLASEFKLGYSSGSFLTGMRAFVEFKDLVFASIKGAVFGAVIPLVSCFFGFRCQSGAEGVGLATTNSVVVASVAIIVLDFVLTYIFSHFY
ncbi:MAG: MlaE family ABC transporter permease [Bdellovibrionales bacterium]